MVWYVSKECTDTSATEVLSDVGNCVIKNVADKVNFVHPKQHISMADDSACFTRLFTYE
jgi:hypothetical protein